MKRTHGFTEPAGLGLRLIWQSGMRGGVGRKADRPGTVGR